MGARHGRVQIDFANLEDLERIYRAMSQGPAQTSRLRSGQSSAGSSTPRRRPSTSAASHSGSCAVSIARASASSRPTSSHTTAVIRVSRRNR